MLRYLFGLVLLLLPLEAIASCPWKGRIGGVAISELAEKHKVQRVLPVDQRLEPLPNFPSALNVVVTSKVLDSYGLPKRSYLRTLSSEPVYGSCGYIPEFGVEHDLIYTRDKDGDFVTSVRSVDITNPEWLARYQATGRDVMTPELETCRDTSDRMDEADECSYFGPDTLINRPSRDLLEKRYRAEQQERDAFIAVLARDTETRIDGIIILKRFDETHGHRTWVFVKNDFGTGLPLVMQADSASFGMGYAGTWVARDGRLVPAPSHRGVIETVEFEQVMSRSWPVECSVIKRELDDECEALYQAFRDAERALPSRELTPAVLAAAYADLPSPPG